MSVEQPENDLCRNTISIQFFIYISPSQAYCASNCLLASDVLRQIQVLTHQDMVDIGWILYAISCCVIFYTLMKICRVMENVSKVIPTCGPFYLARSCACTSDVVC